MERAIIANRKHDKGEVRKEMSERKMKRVEDSLTEQSAAYRESARLSQYLER